MNKIYFNPNLPAQVPRLVLPPTDSNVFLWPFIDFSDINLYATPLEGRRRGWPDAHFILTLMLGWRLIYYNQNPLEWDLEKN